MSVGSGRVQCHGGANERLQCAFVKLLALMEIDGTPGVALEARITVRKVWVSLAGGYPYVTLFRQVYEKLCAVPVKH